jgi:4-hydroxybenzoate polyprenyltransferase
MPFALIGFFLGLQERFINKIANQSKLAGDNSVVFLLILILLCMVFARSAAMAFNRFLDHNIDAKNPRTAVREIPAGIIKPNQALIFTIICCLLFITCTYFINKLCFYLSFVALFIILFYSYTKRFTPLCHLVLGLGLSLAPIGAFIAVTGVFEWLPILISILVLTWVSGFDIIYALQDEAFDKANDLHSIPAWLGKKNALIFSAILHIISACIILIIGFYFSYGPLFWIGAVIFLLMLIYQHTIVKPNDLSRVNVAFMTANGIASIVFAVFYIAHILLSIKSI